MSSISRLWTFVGVSFGFVLLGSFFVLSDFLLFANTPELYCINASGNITTECSNQSTIYTNTSEVCTASNGLCAGAGASGSNDTLILAHECLDATCNTFVYTAT